MGHFTDLNGFHKFTLVEYPPPPVVLMPSFTRGQVSASQASFEQVPITCRREFFLNKFDSKIGLASYEEK